MTLPSVGTCAVCGVAGYLTTKGMRRRHVPPAAEPSTERCPGSGQPPKEILR